MKAVITAAGQGSRSGLDGKLRKEMLPIYDVRDGKIVLRPILDCILTRLAHAGIDEMAVVTDPRDEATIRYVRREFSTVSIIHQSRKLGFGNAVLMAREFVGKDSFILNAGDGMLLDERILKNSMLGNGSENILCLMRVGHPERYGVAQISHRMGKTYVTSVVEKPRKPVSNLALCAVYKLSWRIFEHLGLDNSENVELTPAINALASERQVEGVIVPRRSWQSVGRAEDYVRVLNLTLKYSREIIS